MPVSPRSAPPRAPSLLIVGAIVAFSCTADEAGIPIFPASTPHEKYEFAFRRVGLETSVMGRRWIDASFAALDGALPIDIPYREVGYFDPHDAPSLGYRLTLERGKRVIVETAVPGHVFIDLFRVLEGERLPFQHVHNADSGAQRIDYFVRRSGDYLLRIQPELLVGGEYEVRIVNQASLSFPVANHDFEAIRSRWGASRDGGRRRHEGVDIFAPRRTPAVAAANGQVRSTRPSRLGGKVVWLRTEYGSLYYAHLDSVAVRRGQSVRVGDTVGFVGNTGNARTTPPHLHFGVYSRGATDPEPYLEQPPTDPPALVADETVVGSYVRVVEERVSLRRSPSAGAEVVEQVAEHTPMLVLGGTGEWFRVVLPDATTGFVRARFAEPVSAPIARETLAGELPVRDGPTDSAAVMETLAAGRPVDVLGRYQAYLFVRIPNARPGWIPDAFAQTETVANADSAARRPVVVGEPGQEPPEPN